MSEQLFVFLFVAIGGSFLFVANVFAMYFVIILLFCKLFKSNLHWEIIGLEPNCRLTTRKPQPNLNH